VAAVDTYATITVGPRHQPPLSHDDALKRLQYLSGVSLDPTIVAALERVSTRPIASNSVFWVRRNACLEFADRVKFGRLEA
jgi:HD-GYP domain-containing protein (c-di-GMP phosphodiesterase class II)